MLLPRDTRRISHAIRCRAMWECGFFFFSSRRRHTRFDCDWSSDVCSSDLLIYRALVDHQVDIVAGNSTDGLIDSLGLVALADDRHYFPPYDAVPIVRQSTLADRKSVV